MVTVDRKIRFGRKSVVGGGKSGVGGGKSMVNGSLGNNLGLKREAVGFDEFGKY